MAVGVLAGGAAAPAQTRVSPVDQIIARCPTAAEVAGIQARTPVTSTRRFSAARSSAPQPPVPPT